MYVCMYVYTNILLCYPLPITILNWYDNPT